MSTNTDAIKLNSDAVVSSEPPSNNNIVLTKGVTVDSVVVGDNSLDSNTETLVDGSRVSGDEIGTVMNDDSDVVLDKSISDDAVLFEQLSNRDVDVVNTVKIGADSLGTGTETLTMKPCNTVVQDSVDDSKVSGDEKGIVMDKSALVLDKPISDNVVSYEAMSDRDIDTVNGVKISADSLGLETETITMKATDDHNVDGDLVVQDSVDDTRASRDDKGIVTENVENVLDESEVIEEKEGEYKVTDIVWAKVKNYPWWPGQIFDRSAATEKAKKFSNKKGHLVGYFGDQSFAWNKPPNIKPFRKTFCKLEKQSNSKPYLNAVNCALDEVSRRVDFGLACSCLSKEVYDKIKSQKFVSDGIREQDSKIDGGDRFSTVSTFKPVNAVQSVQELAKEHFDGISRLEALSVRTQLLAFFRWKGRNQLKTHDIWDELDNKLKDESVLPLTEENKVVEDEKLASIGKNISSKKRKLDVCDSDDSVPVRNERSLKNVTPKGNSSPKKTSSKKRKPDNSDSDSDDSVPVTPKAKLSAKKTSAKKRKPDNSDSDSDDSVPLKKERNLTNATPKGISSAKKTSSKKKKPDACDGDDSDDSVPLKKVRSLTNVTPKGNSSAKRSKKGISKKSTVEKEENGNEKTESVGKKVTSKKRKPDVSDSDNSVPLKKEKRVTKVTSKDCSSVKRSKNNISKKTTLKEENGNGTDNSKSSIASPKTFRVGDSICRIAKQISESPVILKKESEKSKKDENSATLRESAKKDGQPVDAIQTEE